MELMGLNLCHLQELLVCNDRLIIEKQKDEHLVGGAEEFVPLALDESTTNLRIAQS